MDSRHPGRLKNCRNLSLHVRRYVDPPKERKKEGFGSFFFLLFLVAVPPGPWRCFERLRGSCPRVDPSAHPPPLPKRRGRRSQPHRPSPTAAQENRDQERARPPCTAEPCAADQPPPRAGVVSPLIADVTSSTELSSKYSTSAFFCPRGVSC